MAWHTAGPLEDPSAGDVLADTGALGVGVSGFTILIDTTAGGYVDLVHRNALNTQDLHLQKLYISPGTPLPLGATLTLALNERLLLRVRDGLTGTIQGSFLM